MKFVFFFSLCFLQPPARRHARELPASRRPCHVLPSPPARMRTPSAVPCFPLPHLSSPACSLSFPVPQRGRNPSLLPSSPPAAVPLPVLLQASPRKLLRLLFLSTVSAQAGGARSPPNFRPRAATAAGDFGAIPASPVLPSSSRAHSSLPRELLVLPMPLNHRITSSLLHSHAGAVRGRRR